MCRVTRLLGAGTARRPARLPPACHKQSCTSKSYPSHCYSTKGGLASVCINVRHSTERIWALCQPMLACSAGHFARPRLCHTTTSTIQGCATQKTLMYREVEGAACAGSQASTTLLSSTPEAVEHTPSSCNPTVGHSQGPAALPQSSHSLETKYVAFICMHGSSSLLDLTPARHDRRPSGLIFHHKPRRSRERGCPRNVASPVPGQQPPQAKDESSTTTSRLGNRSRGLACNAAQQRSCLRMRHTEQPGCGPDACKRSLESYDPQRYWHPVKTPGTGAPR